MTWEIKHGDCRDVLKTLEAKSVQTVATSPPFWGLRDYGLEPQVWGGDAGCEHDFVGVIVNEHRAQGTHGKSRTTDRFYGGDPSRRFDEDHQRHYSTHLCRCGAWRGSLGLEPTPELYVEHLVKIFREVRRVLRNDGTLWLNLGDSYAGGHTTYDGKDPKWQHGAGQNRRQADHTLGGDDRLHGEPAVFVEDMNLFGPALVIWRRAGCLLNQINDWREPSFSSHPIFPIYRHLI